MRKRRSRLGILFVSALFLGAGGGCIALGYDFDKEPPAGCKTAADCPGDLLCGKPACEAGVCKVLTPLGAGEAPLGQPSGDCRKIKCDGKGNAITERDDLDVLDDGKQCTANVCKDGIAENPNLDAGAPCGAADKLQCNGVGSCVGCMNAADCGADTACTQWSCEMGTCIPVFAEVGTLASNTLPGDCKARLCDEHGQEVEQAYKLDPADDSNECTVDTCAQDGTTVHNAAPTGTVCGTTDCQMCAAGQCGACDPVDYACSNQVCTLLQKLPIGKPCASNLDCADGQCVDGVCCESSCTGQCMGCSHALTNEEDGLCRNLIDGTDPNDECKNPNDDVCSGGQCQCNDKVQNGAETGVDCGGKCLACPGHWVCSGVNGCDSDPNPTCCDPLCFLCIDQGFQCKALHGKPCAVGEADKELTLGVVPNDCFVGTSACQYVTCTCL